MKAEAEIMVQPTPLFASLRGLGNNEGQPPEPPDNDMETRITKLEALAEKVSERLNGIDRDLAVLRSESRHFATKEDLARVEGGLQAKIAESQNKVIMWVVSAIFLAQLLPALLKKFGL
jgi:hypothetical protein